MKDRLFRFANKMLGHTEEAEDVVQEVFLKLWKKREQLDEYRSLEALAMISVKNLCFDKMKARKWMIENFNDHRRFLENIPDETVPIQGEMTAFIKRVITTLPEQQQLIIHLRDIEGYEFDEISDIMKMNENAIRVALSRARKHVREILIKKMHHE
ncbi:MAG TPA: sigma-70 family RNA polymerase sigma factor [Bacteroidales bacterium]|nr:sigma-70 family RNA polymerase sigma factor [Bacteroidales bacterium]HPT09711.1 sigma-70 family RNA polymerase sigma factor [Bacteroidales bacterium]